MIKNFQVGVKGVVRVGDSVLVLQKGNDDSKYWNIPGGRIDDEETVEETLRRELQEELPTLTDYKIKEILSVYRLSKNIQEELGLILIFYRIEAEKFDVEFNSEHCDYKWVTKDTVSELLTSGIAIEPGYYDALIQALKID